MRVWDWCHKVLKPIDDDPVNVENKNRLTSKEAAAGNIFRPMPAMLSPI
jgi:hypothetical protein